MLVRKKPVKNPRIRTFDAPLAFEVLSARLDG